MRKRNARSKKKKIARRTSRPVENPAWLWQDPVGVVPKSAYRVSDLDLASRLSFFLWSSAPDDELLDLAARNELRKFSA